MSPIKLFGTRQVRSIWDAERELWFFSIVDVVSALTDSADANAYWRVLKQRLKAEGNEPMTNCHGLKMSAADGKMRLTDVADTEQLLRLVQSIPSPKAEPFKQWLAQVGSERIEETEDPERALDRAMETYLKKGYSKEWVNQRLKSIEVRKDLTDEWEERGIQKGRDFAILTDGITRAWSGFNTREYKQAKVFAVAVDLQKRAKTLSQKPWRPRFCVFPNRGALRHELTASGGLAPMSYPTGSESPPGFHAKYQFTLPSEDELQREILRERALIENQQAGYVTSKNAKRLK